MPMEKPYKLLIIDDNEEILIALRDYFSRKNYTVISAPNGLEGLKLIDDFKETIDLIITDLVMPNVSGVAVISIVKKKYPEIPIIAITGWGEHPESLAEEARADLVLEKPFDLTELDKHMKQLLSRKKFGSVN
jgi:DNA-binding response OmpR family regulator